MKTRFLIPLLCGAACEKDDGPKTAPPITQENSFSCKINGGLFIPKDHYEGIYLASGMYAGILADHSWDLQLADQRIYIM